MASQKKYNVKEVLNFTVEDLQGISVVDIKGWKNLAKEKRDECIKHLRDLVRQRDETIQSVPVDGAELGEKLRQISSRQRSPSPTSSIVTPPPPTIEEVRERHLQMESEAYRSLINEGGIPSHLIELGFDVLDNPEEYPDIKDIVSYWGSEAGHWLGFIDQLDVWRQFRSHQRRVRPYYIKRGIFSEYQRRVYERRQKRGLKGDAELCQDRDEQSKLANWIEYQNYHLLKLENFENKIEDIQGKLDIAQRNLRDAGVRGFDREFKPGNFDNVLALNIRYSSENPRARRRKEMMEQELEVAETRLKAAQSDDLGDTVDRSVWIGLAQAHFESAREQMDKMGDNWQDLHGEAFWKWHTTEEELIRAEKVLGAAQSDDFGRPVQRTTLLRVVSEEVRAAQIRLDEAIKSQEQVKLRAEVLGELSGLELTKMKLKRHEILLKWIEWQRRKIVSECAISARGARGLEELTCRVTRSATRSRLQEQENHLVEPARTSTGDGRKRRRNGDRADELSKRLISKKQGHDVGDSRPTCSASAWQEEERPKRRRRDYIIVDEQPSKRLKYNYQDPKLADRKASNAATGEGHGVKSGKKPAHVRQQTSLDSDKAQPDINGQTDCRQTRSKQLPKPEKRTAVLQPTHSSRIRKAKRPPGARRHSDIRSSDQNGISLHKRKQGNQSQPVRPPTRRSARIGKPPKQFCLGEVEK